MKQLRFYSGMNIENSFFGISLLGHEPLNSHRSFYFLGLWAAAEREKNVPLNAKDIISVVFLCLCGGSSL